MTKSPMSDTALLNRTLHLPNGSVLRNRLAKSSMSETLATYDNHPTLAGVNYLGGRIDSSVLLPELTRCLT